MTHQLTSLSVAIKDLVAHPANVRAKSTEAYAPENIALLVASIAAHGVLQPLLVQKIEGGYGVLGGGRRRAALMALVADKKVTDFKATTKIECRVIADDCDVTTAMSLAENITQEPMGAIDEYEAFARMMEVDHLTPEQIALTFGTTVAAVKGRLRFGLVHPNIRNAARQKTISLDAMKAFADHPNQDAQLEVFEALTRDGQHMQGWAIKSAIKSRGIQMSDTLGAFVKDDYEARGGPIARDLLEEHSVLEDMGLVQEILMEKLEAAAEAKRAELGFAWAIAAPRYDHADLAGYTHIYPEPVEPDEAGQKRLDEIIAEIDTLNAELEAEDLEGDAYNARYDRVEALEAEAEDLQQAYCAEHLAIGGVHATWHNGEIMFTTGLVKRAVEPPRADGDYLQDGGEVPGEEGTEANNAEGDGDIDIVYSAALADDLKTERAMALGAAMAGNPQATADLAMFKLVCDVICLGSATYAIDLRGSAQHRGHAKLDEIDPTPAQQMATAEAALNLSWADEKASPAERFQVFRTLTWDEKAALIAYATAKTTQSAFARHRNQDPLMHDFEIEIMPNIRAHWTPNAALFGRFKKAWLLQILNKDLGLTQEALTLAGSSKKDIVAFCDKLFAEPFATLTEAQRAAVANWCPPLMQTTGGYRAQLDEDPSAEDQEQLSQAA